MEKLFLSLLNQKDDLRKANPTIDVAPFVDVMRSDQLQNSCQFSDREIRGLMAEAFIDEQGEIPYVDHVKTWLPILFEMRKSKYYEVLFTKFDDLRLVDLSHWEESYPVEYTACTEKKNRGDIPMHTQSHSDLHKHDPMEAATVPRPSGRKRLISLKIFYLFAHI